MLEPTESSRGFSIVEFANTHRIRLAILLVGSICIGLGLLFTRFQSDYGTKVEVLGVSTPEPSQSKIIIEVSGSVSNPGVYSLGAGSRIADALSAAGGITENANAPWVDRFINKAAPVTDGQKIYIPTKDEQSVTTSDNNSGEGSGYQTISQVGAENKININTASKTDLEQLWGIGPVTAQKLIDQRPYSTVEELLSKKILKQNVYDRIKDQLSVY